MAMAGTPQRIYRAMKADGHQPAITPGKTKGIGVRPRDIVADEDGNVHPGTGGMTAAPNDPMNLARPFRPVALGGRSQDDLWEFDPGDLPDTLEYVLDSETHGVIAPARTMSYDDYCKELAATCANWRLIR
jgi:hypothetical protein